MSLKSTIKYFGISFFRWDLAYSAWWGCCIRWSPTMPLAIRIPHTLEILADSFVHAGLLVILLVGSNLVHHEALQTTSENA